VIEYKDDYKFKSEGVLIWGQSTLSKGGIDWAKLGTNSKTLLNFYKREYDVERKMEKKVNIEYKDDYDFKPEANNSLGIINPYIGGNRINFSYDIILQRVDYD
jgi:hypothetical protein